MFLEKIQHELFPKFIACNFLFEIFRQLSSWLILEAVEEAKGHLRTLLKFVGKIGLFLNT